LVIQNALEKLDIERVVKCDLFSASPGIIYQTNDVTVIVSLQQPSGVFAGDSFGELDTRFLYCAVNALSLLGRLSAMNVDQAVSYIRQCRNFDGGFGSCIGAESHAAQGGLFTFPSVAYLHNAYQLQFSCALLPWLSWISSMR
jgi:geranylgeranyl transferase type-2 subunit beta